MIVSHKWLIISRLERSQIMTIKAKETSINLAKKRGYEQRQTHIN